MKDSYMLTTDLWKRGPWEKRIWLSLSLFIFYENIHRISPPPCKLQNTNPIPAPTFHFNGVITAYFVESFLVFQFTVYRTV